MPRNTVQQFAADLRMPADLLIAQLKAAGVEKSSEMEPLTKSEKDVLLEYLRKTHGADATKRPITLVRKDVARDPDGEERPGTIRVEVRKKRIFVPRDSLGLTNNAGVTDIDLSSLAPQTEQKGSRAIKWFKLSTLEIKNFKAIESVEIPLADVTILVGPNGSGKSSVLQAVHWAARAASYIQPKNQTEVIGFDRLDYSPSSEPLLSAHKRELSSDRGSDPTTVTFNHIGPDSTGSSAATVKIWAARNRSGISVSIDGGPAVTPFKQRSELLTAYIPGLAGLAERETILVQPLLRRQAASGDAGGVLRNVLLNIASRQAGELGNEEASRRLAKLNELVQIIHPDVKLEVSFDDREDFNIQTYFEDRKLAGAKRPLETAATGVLQVVQIFAYLILFRPKIMLVDEPDAHLHPDKQERFIEALEKASIEFETQSIITTHSPHIVRAASSDAKLVWLKDGSVVGQDDDTIRALLGWGGLDKRVLFFVEDENDKPIRSILRQWPNLYRQLAICRCFGIDNLPRNPMLRGLLDDGSLSMKILIHRDRDFMTDEDGAKWIGKYNGTDVKVWITDGPDAESYFCAPEYLAELYSVDLPVATKWVQQAIDKCSKSREVFYEKRKVVVRTLYENGGGLPTDELWERHSGSSSSVLGKTLHKALKGILEESKQDSKILDKFPAPQSSQLAVGLKKILEEMLR